MNEQQKTQYVAFMANFINLMAKDHVHAEQAQKAALAAASCLLGVVFGLEPTDDDNPMNVDDFVVPVIRAALNSFYGMQTDRAMLN